MFPLAKPTEMPQHFDQYAPGKAILRPAGRLTPPRL